MDPALFLADLEAKPGLLPEPPRPGTRPEE